MALRGKAAAVEDHNKERITAMKESEKTTKDLTGKTKRPSPAQRSWIVFVDMPLLRHRAAVPHQTAGGGRTESGRRAPLRIRNYSRTESRRLSNNLTHSRQMLTDEHAYPNEERFMPPQLVTG